MVAFKPGLSITAGLAYKPGAQPAFDGGGFLPNSISDLGLWFDASARPTITESGGKISQWDDKSPAGSDSIQGTGANQPTTNATTQNNKNVVDYDGTDYMVAAGATSIVSITTDHTIFVVFKLANTATEQQFLNGSNSGSDLITLQVASNAIISGYFNGTTYSRVSNPFDDLTDFHTITILHANAATPTGFIDGVAMTGTAAPAANFGNLAIGARPDGANALINGASIAEILIYTRVLPTVEINTVETYLDNKWGIGFSPLSIGGLHLWLDASDSSTITSSGGKVSKWDDKSGSSRDAIQGTGAKQPTTNATTQNGRNTLDFDGSSDYMISTYGITLAQPTTIFFVGKLADTNGGDYFVDGIIVSQRQLLFALSGTLTYGFYSGNTVDSGVAITTNYTLQTVEYNGASSKMYIDGNLAVTGDAFGLPATGLTIGSDVTNGFFFQGSIAEIIIYDRILSTAERQAVDNYVNNKWSIY